MTSIRGAITLRANTKEAVREASLMLIRAALDANQVETNQVIDIIFTATEDITAANPAAAARELGLTQAGLISMREMPVDGSLPLCVRLLMHVEQGKTQAQMHHVFLRGAVVLRPELTFFAVAIDGPSGAGKSTAAKLTAAALGMTYIDTGAMYRAVALYVMKQGASLHDPAAVERLLPDIDITLHPSPQGQRLLLNGQDVTEALRVQAVAEGSSVVACYEAVRDKLSRLQRGLALTRHVVMDGRDIGTRIMPWAPVKIYLDASLDARVGRRVQELTEKGEPADPAAVRRAIETRDERDTQRALAPLTRTEDALYIDSSDMSTQAVSNQIIEAVKAAGYHPPAPATQEANP